MTRSGWRNPSALVLAGVVVLAATLRLVGLRFGLPAVYNPDEMAIMARALAFAKGDLNPHNFLYPTAYFYALFAWVGAYFTLAWLAGAVHSLAAFQASFFTDPSGIYLAGRLLGVASGVLTVALVFIAARRLFGTRAALAAAFFLAVSPLHVVDSHYVKHDVPTTLAIVVAFVATVSIWPLEARGRSLRTAAVAGLACGVAFSMHYYAVFTAVPLIVALFFAHGPRGGRAVGPPLGVALAAMAAGLVVCSPFLLVDAGTAWRDIVANRQIVIDRAVGTSGMPFASARRYLELLWLDALGWPVMALALGGALRLAWQAPRRLMLLASFPAAFLLFIANTVAASRYLNPVVPFAAILAGHAVSELARRVRASTIFAVGLGLVSGMPALSQSVRAGIFFRQTDTRTLAAEFVTAHVPAGAGVAVQPYSVVLAPTRDSLLATLEANVGGRQNIPTRFRLQLATDPWPEPAYRLTYIGEGGLDADKVYVSYASLGGARGLEALRDREVGWIVVKRVRAPAPGTEPFLESLARQARLLAVFAPYRDARPAGRAGAPAAAVEPFLHNTDSRILPELARPGPVVEVWRLDGTGEGNRLPDRDEPAEPGAKALGRR